MDMQTTSLIVLAWELFNQGVPKRTIAGNLGKHRETIHLWIGGIRAYGLMKFLDLYEQAKKGPRKRRQVATSVKRLVWEIRERERDCCGQKIAYFLEKERQTHLSVPKIYEILAERYTLRSKWKKNQARGPVPHPTKAREVVQMDTVDFGGLFAFCGIDCFSREADVLLAPELTSRYGSTFLKRSMKRRFDGYAELVQTDGGPEFKDKFLTYLPQFCNLHRIARPYKKNEQAYIESFNRTLRKECLGWAKYKPRQLKDCTRMVESFLNRYHYHRPHMGLGMKPPLLAAADCRIFTEN